MKYCDLNSFIEENGLCKKCITEPGIYAILIDDKVAYINAAKSVLGPAKEEIYRIENSMLIGIKMYQLLLSAKLGGYDVDCYPVVYCSYKDARKVCGKLIDELNIPLNNAQLFNEMKIDELLKKLEDDKFDINNITKQIKSA